MHHWNRKRLPPVGAYMNPLPIILDSYNLAAAERQLCAAALDAGGGIVPAAQLLGVTRAADHQAPHRVAAEGGVGALGPASGGLREPPALDLPTPCESFAFRPPDAMRKPS